MKRVAKENVTMIAWLDIDVFNDIKVSVGFILNKTCCCDK